MLVAAHGQKDEGKPVRSQQVEDRRIEACLLRIREGRHERRIVEIVEAPPDRPSGDRFALRLKRVRTLGQRHDMAVADSNEIQRVCVYDGHATARSGATAQTSTPIGSPGAIGPEVWRAIARTS